MQDYDSDSSGVNDDDVATDVVLGYASSEPIEEDFSQLGGHPTWLDPQTPPSGDLVKCRTCNSLMSLLLQIKADIPDRFPQHERRLYVWACRRKACRRKDGSVRAFRAVRHHSAPAETKTGGTGSSKANASSSESTALSNSKSAQPTNLGETLFGVKSPAATGKQQANPFATRATATSGLTANPFSTKPPPLIAQPVQSDTTDTASTSDSLDSTFAAKARISSPQQEPSKEQTVESTPWPSQDIFPAPYPVNYIDAEGEWIEAENDARAAASAAKASIEKASSSAAADADDKLAFESSMDKTFQRFADRLAQNPEQIFRYEFAGQPLLYTRDDKVGKLLATGSNASQGANAKVKVAATASSTKIPRCTNCGAGRVFELQLVPHAITALEADEISLDGMDWGTILLGVCSVDCAPRGTKKAEVRYLEEWVGVQWEEIAKGN